MVSAADSDWFPSQPLPVSHDMMHVQQHLSEVSLTEVSSGGATPSQGPWSDDEAKFNKFESLKNVALGNCRLLYGSERMKFYDLVLAIDEAQSTFCVALVCSRDTASKILRTSVSDCPVKAIHAIVNQLQKDTMPLLMKFGAGTQMRGQQGYTNSYTGEFELEEAKNVEKPSGPVDDTETLPGRKIDSYVPLGAPRGPRHDRAGFKRARREDDRVLNARFADARMADAQTSDPVINEDFYDSHLVETKE